MSALEFGELSVRTRPRGGTIYYGMQARGELGRLTDDRIIFLVHGFNVDSESAHKTYEDFLGRLRDHIWPIPLERLGTFWGFHWPGDHQSRPISVVTFPVRIGMAQDAGRQLAELIMDRLKPHQEVFFVAHSLGCRVVLGALYEIVREEAKARRRLGVPVHLGAPVRGVFLMAGAVPFELCQDGRIFRRRDPNRPRDWVLHSTEDRTLRRFFPRGEWAQGEGGGEAIGRRGLPGGRWHRSIPTELDHGDYWKTWPDVIENVPVMLGALVPSRLRAQPSGSGSGGLPSSRLPTNQVRGRKIGAPLGSSWSVLIPEA